MPGKPEPGFIFQEPYLPAVSERVARILGKLCMGKRVLELGSGASTLFFAQRAEYVYAIETDEDWGYALRRSQPEQLQNIGVRLVRRGGVADCVNYLEANSFDLVFVDCYGLDRPAGLMAAARVLKTDSFMVVDDAHWRLLQVPLRWLLDNGYVLVRSMPGTKRHLVTGKIVKAQTDFYKRIA